MGAMTRGGGIGGNRDYLRALTPFITIVSLVSIFCSSGCGACRLRNQELMLHRFCLGL